VVGHNLDVGRQDAFVQLLRHGLDAPQNHLRLLAHAHEDDAFDGFILLHVAELAEARGVADLDLGDVFYIDGDVALLLQDDVADVGGGLDEAEAADVIELAALGIEAAAGVGVIVAQLLGDLRHGEAVGEELIGIEQHLILHGGAAKTRIVGHPLNGPVMALHNPIFNHLQILRGTVRALQDVAVDQAAGAEERGHAGLQASRQGGVADAFKGLLADEVRVRAILEIHLHAGKPVEGDGAQGIQFRNPVHFDFDGNGDKALHLFGGVSGPLGDDLDVGGGEIRVSVDGQFLERHRAPEHKRKRSDDDEEPLLQGEGDKFRDRLEMVHKGLGEMQSLATGVGDLKRIFSNVKVRGTWAEVQVAGILEQM